MTEGTVPAIIKGLEGMCRLDRRHHCLQVDVLIGRIAVEHSQFVQRDIIVAVPVDQVLNVITV